MSKIKKIKKTAVRRSKQKPKLVVASGASAFWVHQGPILRNLWDLAKFFELMTEEQFVYHVKPSGNDFARWVSEILQDKICARALIRAKTGPAALAVVRRALARYDV